MTKKPRHIACTMEEYHARKELSNSQATDYLQSPPYFYGLHVADPPLYDRPAKQVYAFGTATHQLFSAPGAIDEVALEIPIDSFKTQKGQPAKNPLNTDDYKKWVEDHPDKIYLKPEEMRAARIMVRHVYEHPIAARLFCSALHFEHTLIWKDRETGLGLRARPDLITGWQGAMVPSDFKTTRALTPWEFARDARKFGYHRQAAWYTEPLKLMGYEVPGFFFIAVDKSPAHECRVYEMDPEDIKAGAEEIRQVRHQIAERLDRPDAHEESAWRSELDTIAPVISLPKWKDQY